MERSCIPLEFPDVLCPEALAVGEGIRGGPVHLYFQARTALGTSFLCVFKFSHMFIFSTSDRVLSEMQTEVFLPKEWPCSTPKYLRGT